MDQLYAVRISWEPNLNPPRYFTMYRPVLLIDNNFDYSKLDKELPQNKYPNELLLLGYPQIEDDNQSILVTTKGYLIRSGITTEENFYEEPEFTAIQQ